MALGVVASFSGTLAMGSDERGELTEADSIPGVSSYMQAWQFTGQPGQTATVELISTEFDTYLWAGGGGISLYDDDAAGNCNSAITLTLPESGSVNIGVAPYGGAATGRFRLRVLREPGPVEAGGCGGGTPSPGVRESCGEMLSDLSIAGVLERERVVRGTLTGADAVCPQGSYLQAWELEGTEGEIVTVDLSSGEYDTFLYVTGPGFEIPLTDDDDGGACNSRIEIAFPETGVYRVVASSYRERRTGRFGLRVTDNPPPPRTGNCPIDDQADDIDSDPWSAFSLSMLSTEKRSISVGENVNGFLSSDDPRGGSGAYVQAWDLDALGGTFVMINLVSDEFDTFVAVTGPGMTGVETDDDGGDGTNSRLSVEVPDDGEITIVVSSFSDDGSGEFTLSVEERERK